MLVLWLVEKGLTSMKCGVYSPLNDCCTLDCFHFGPHVSKDKAEWFGNVWLKEPVVEKALTVTVVTPLRLVPGAVESPTVVPVVPVKAQKPVKQHKPVYLPPSQDPEFEEEIRAAVAEDWRLARKEIVEELLKSKANGKSLPLESEEFLLKYG